MNRLFQTLFGLTEDQDVRRTAIAACREGYAVVPIVPGGKAPICTLTTADLKRAGKDHDCGVYHAITDPKVADRVFARLGKVGRLNLGMVAGPSRVIVVDADTASEVVAFQTDWASADGPEYLAYNPTVTTPGLKNEAGEWVHKDGGHWYFDLPDGVDLDWSVVGSLKRNGYDIRWGMQQTLLPPSVRAEGGYKVLSEVLEAPVWLLEVITRHIAQMTERRARTATLVRHDGIAAWSVATPWALLLSAHDWTDSGKLDRCGCGIWTKPGGGSTSYKSATAHEAGCDQYDLLEGHGPLHLWTTDPPGPLVPFVEAGRQTITKLQFVTAMEHDGDEAAAMEALGLDRIDLSGWLDGPDDSSSEAVRTVTDDVTDTGVSEPSGRQDTVSDHLVGAVDAMMLRDGIPEHLRDKVMQSAAKRMIDRAAADAVSAAGRNARGDISGWLPGPGDIEAFLCENDDPGPVMLPRTDDLCLLYAGRTNVIVGRRGAGKTWLAMLAAKEALEAGKRVMYFDMEDTRQAWRARMKAMGCDIDQYVKDGMAVWKQPPDVPEDVETLIEAIGQFDLVVFDVLNRMITRMGGTPDNGNAEVLWLYDNLFDPLARRYNVCVLLLDHPNKRGQRMDSDSLDDLQPGGGAMKMNNASGLVIGMIPKKPFTRSDPAGHVTLFCLKDRSGHFEESQPVGEFKGDMFNSNGDIGLGLKVSPPDEVLDDMQTDLNHTKDSIRKALATRPLTKGGLKPFVTKRLREWVDLAIDDLVLDGEVVFKDDDKFHLVDPDDVTDTGASGSSGRQD